MISTTGRPPAIAAPIAAPVKPSSEIGVSRTRSGPNSSSSPASRGRSRRRARLPRRARSRARRAPSLRAARAVGPRAQSASHSRGPPARISARSRPPDGHPPYLLSRAWIAIDVLGEALHVRLGAVLGELDRVRDAPLRPLAQLLHVGLAELELLGGAIQRIVAFVL